MGYTVVGAQVMHRTLHRDEKWRWYVFDVLFPVMGALAVIFLIMPFAPYSHAGRWAWAGYSFIACVLGVIGASLGANLIRPRLMSMLFGLRPRRVNAASGE
jgi:hypothetical protein